LEVLADGSSPTENLALAQKSFSSRCLGLITVQSPLDTLAPGVLAASCHSCLL
jgi:hypothetical protein